MFDIYPRYFVQNRYNYLYMIVYITNSVYFYIVPLYKKHKRAEIGNV